MTIIFDIETDGLIETATKIHCLCYQILETGETGSFTTLDSMRNAITVWRFEDENLRLVGHNIIRFDIPVLEKFLEIDLSGIKQIDTLALSWYLYPNRLIHGLNAWGNEFNIEKPKIG